MAVASLLAAGAVVACGVPGEPPERPWAREATEVMERIGEGLDSDDPYEAALLFSAGGTLDLAHFGLGVATSPNEVLEQLSSVWFLQPGRADVRLEHVFVSADGAVVWWYAFDLAGRRTQDVAQTFVFGRNDRVASRTFGDVALPFWYEGREELEMQALVERYLAAWSGLVPIEEVYAVDAVVRDSLRDVGWGGRDEIVSMAPGSGPIERGPFPVAFQYAVGDHRELILVVQLAGDCPQLEARRLVLDRDLVVHESRFVHVPSLRRCGPVLGEGWWSTFTLLTEPRDNVTEVVDLGGASIELVHAEPVHERFVRWMVDRFQAGGLGSIELDSVWFPPSPDCLEQIGIAIQRDERHGDERAVVVCFDEYDVVSGGSESGFSTPAIATGLHELAHLWMRQRLDDGTRAAFTNLVGAPAWRSAPTETREWGVELAAYTIGWGLAGTADARFPLYPVPSCAQLSSWFVLLTGREPITECGPSGWSQ